MARVARLDRAGHITEFPLPDPNSNLAYIIRGSDGNLWFTEGAGRIGRMSVQGSLTEFPLPAHSQPEGITNGPDGAVWFADSGTNAIGRITTSGQVREFGLPRHQSVQCGYVCPLGIVTGPDGNLWFTESQFSAGGGNKIGRMTTAGRLTEYSIPTANAGPSDITVGADRNIWFGEAQAGKIGRITTSGAITEYPLHTASQGAAPGEVAKGPFNCVWFPVSKAAGGSEASGNQLGRITTDGSISGYQIPGQSQVTRGIATDDGSVWFAYDDQIWRFVPKR